MLMPSQTTRRKFLRKVSLAAVSTSFAGSALTAWAGAKVKAKTRSPEEQNILDLISAHRPSQMVPLPAGFNARFGATHCGGKYCLTQKPFLIEGAEKLLELGSRLGKFWFNPHLVQSSYPFHSSWGKYETLVDLAKSEYFQEVWKMPFKIIALEAHTRAEDGWSKAKISEGFYTSVTKEYYNAAAYFYQLLRDRPMTIVLQNWEGDWMLRGAGKDWNPPPPDWRARCERLQRLFAARQAGVSQARAEFSAGARCFVALAVEVNRVADGWKGIPTVTRNVLPGIEVDLISYSAYDGIGDPLLFWNCLAEIRRYARTGKLFGPGALAIGEFGISENMKPDRIRERYDEMLGVMLAAKVLYGAQWELYCNEFKDDENPPPIPISDPNLMNGLWLVKPDGSLSEGGKYFREMWARAEAEKNNIAH